MASHSRQQRTCLLLLLNATVPAGFLQGPHLPLRSRRDQRHQSAASRNEWIQPRRPAMATHTPVFDEQLERISSEVASKLDGAQTGALLDPDTGKREGILVTSFLENVAVFGHTGDVLSLADVRHLHRASYCWPRYRKSVSCVWRNLSRCCGRAGRGDRLRSPAAPPPRRTSCPDHIVCGSFICLCIVDRPAPLFCRETGGWRTSSG